MQFLNPLFLLGSLAVIGPILLHLIRKEESKKVPFSSLMFVTRVPKRSFRRQTLRHRLLLLLRVAGLILLALAFARPFFVSKLAAPLTSVRDKSLVVLIDNSFSMATGDRFGRAKQQALKILDSLNSQSTVQVVLYSDTTQVLNNLQAERSSLRSLLQQAHPTDRKTNHLSALKLAQQLLASAPHQQREIHWISDFQQSGWSSNPEDAAIGSDLKIQPYDVAETEEGNLSVNQSQVNQLIEGDTLFTRVSARVSAYAMKSAVTTTVALELNGKRLQAKEVSVETDGSKLVEFESFPSPPGVSKGEIRLDSSDPLQADNIYHFTLNGQRKVKLLLLSDRGARDNFYIAKALSASKDSPFQLETQEAGQGPLDLTKCAAVVLNNLSTIPPNWAAPLQEFVIKGGGLVTILGSRTRAIDLNERLEKILPAKLTDKRVGGSRDKERFLGEMQKEHPVFEIFQGTHQSYFMTTAFSGVFGSVPAERSQVLAKLEDGTPLLVARDAGSGRSLLFTSSLNMEWNDLPLKSVFLPFLHQMVKYSTSHQDDKSAFEVGEVIPMSVVNPMLGKALNQISRIQSFSQSWKVLTPSGATVELADRDLQKAPFFQLEEPGFYQSRVHNFDHAVAVNIVPSESDLRKIAPEKVLASLLRVSPPRTTPVAGDASLDQRQAWESQQQVWWYLLALALLVLAVESFVSNRYYRNVADSL